MRRPVLWAVLALSVVVPAAPPATSPGARAQDIPASATPALTPSPSPAADTPELGALYRAAARYQALADAGGWPTLPADLRLGTPADAPTRRRARPDPVPTPEVLQRLCERLAIEGALDAAACQPPMAPATYDARLQEAVRWFQARHGLEVDGVVGASTVAELNVPAADRVAQIAANVARRRALPADLGPLYVRVNVPAFSLALVDQGREVLTLRVITGTVRTPTPEFSAAIEALDFRPYWKVPDSIYYKEVLPKLRRDAAVELAKERFEVLDQRGRVVDPSGIDWYASARSYRLRQTPGPHNALGLLKFDLPNPHDVYLHDTPTKARFLQHRRAFSHGCIRVQDPAALAAALMAADPAWPRAAIDAAMQGPVSRRVPLPVPVPVHVVYFTAVVEGDDVRFFPDLYGRDRRAAASGPTSGAEPAAAR